MNVVVRSMTLPLPPPAHPICPQTLILACKRADPPQSAAAASVLREAARMGVPMSSGLFNRVLDVCRSAGAWRRALVVYQALLAAGCAPSTATWAGAAAVAAHG